KKSGATVNKIPSVNETLALLDNLRQTIRDFAAREDKLNTDFHNRSDAAHKLYEEQTQKMESDWQASLAAAEENLQNKNSQAQPPTDNRKNRIEDAYKRARDKAASTVEKQDAKWRGQVQEGLTEAEQQRDSDLAAAATTNENFRQKFAETSETF